MVAFFTAAGQQRCPSGWSEAALAQGYVILGTTNPDYVAGQNGSPIVGTNAPTHRHEYTQTVNLHGKKLDALDTCHWYTPCSRRGAKSGKKTISGTTDEATSAYPFRQLLVCQKN